MGNPIELTDDHLASLNEISKDFLCIEWWDTFDELVRGDSVLAKDTRECLREGDSEA